MEKIQVKMKTSVKSFGAGESYEVDLATGQAWIDAGVAEAIEVSNVEKQLADLQKSIEERDSKLIESLTKTFKTENAWSGKFHSHIYLLFY